jgi:hypothetical protein
MLGVLGSAMREDFVGREKRAFDFASFCDFQGKCEPG